MLPSGAPGGKGLPLDDSISGAATHAKSEDDIRQDRYGDESMYRVDDPGDIAKDQTVPDGRDHRNFKPRYEPPGQDTTPKTKYPYRDGIPHVHNARTLKMGPKDVARSLSLLASRLEAPHPSRKATVREIRRILSAVHRHRVVKTANLNTYKNELKSGVLDLLEIDNTDTYGIGTAVADILYTLAYILKSSGYRTVAAKLFSLQSELVNDTDAMDMTDQEP